MTTRIQNFKIYYPSAEYDQTAKHSCEEECILVLIHGLNGNLLTWTPNLGPALAKQTNMKVVTYDQPCYGRNPLPFNQIDDLLELQAKQQIELEQQKQKYQNDDDDDQQQQKSEQKQQQQVSALRLDETKMLQELETIMKPQNLAVELLKLLQALNIVDSENFSPKYVKKPFIHVFGQSFGGKTAITFADRYPHLVASLSIGDIGICPSQKYTIETARLLAVEYFSNHMDRFPDEESVKSYIQSVFGSDGGGGDDIGKKSQYDPSKDQWISLVRPHVGYIHDFLSRKIDLRDAWADYEGPVLAIRAGDAYTCLSDQEWNLMKDLRRQSQPEQDNQFITPSADGHHGVYRSHEDLFLSIYSNFILKHSYNNK